MDIENLSKVTNRELLGELGDRGFFVSKIPPTASGKVFKADVTHMSGNKYRFGVISCTQLGSRYQQLTHLNTFYTICAKRRITEIYHCGDLVDGERVYRGHEYELFLHGADAQSEYVVDNYPKRNGITTSVIMGNHDEAFWKNSGINVVKNICSKRDDMKYLGDYLAYLEIDNIKIALMHGAGGASYARSYKLQKIVEQLSPESKPHMLFLGHYHVQCHIPAYRNCDSFMMGCFQSQTPFLTRLGLFPNIGGLIVEIVIDETGLKSVKSEWIPFYVPKKNDF